MLSRLAGRQLPSPFLTFTHHLDLFETWPQQWGRFFAPGNELLEEPPDEVREEREQEQHKHPADPDQEVHRQLRRVDFLLIHASS